MSQHILNKIFPAGVPVQELGILPWNDRLPLPMFFGRNLRSKECFPHRMAFYGISLLLGVYGEGTIRTVLNKMLREAHNVKS